MNLLCCQNVMEHYTSKLIEQHVLEIVNRNKLIIEPHGDIVDSAFSSYKIDHPHNMDSFAQQENEKTNTELELNNAQEVNEEVSSSDCNIDFSVLGSSSIPADSDVNSNIRSLNRDQRAVFDAVHKWAWNYVKCRSSKIQHEVEPVHLFITGGGGYGKSHLFRTIYQAVTKTLMYNGGDPDKPRVMSLAPTDVAVVNMDGTTIHSGLGINCKGQFFPLNDKQKASLRNKISEVKLLIIDEISIVSRTLFYQINLWLIEIFGFNKPFGGLSVIVCGDFYQLLPLNSPAIYSQLDLKKVTVKFINGIELWYLFKMAELTEVMRQRDDTRLIEF